MKVILFSFFFQLAVGAFSQELPTFRVSDKIRIREAITISKKFGDNLFPGYSKVPFAIVLVTDSIEFLMYHPNPTPDFILMYKDSILKSNIYYRRRTFSQNFLATFPAVNGLSCIVVGIPENTQKNSSEWIITLLHEHFHQYQNSAPDYFKSIDDLKLSGGDESGMWMLNYAFPYDSIPVKIQFENYSRALYKTVNNISNNKFNLYFKKYIEERKKLQNLLSPSDYRYFSLQLWQEGLARYTEYKFLDLLVNYTPSKELLSLPDFETFNKLKHEMYKDEVESLLKNKLNEAQRIAFYSIGFAEGLLLDKLNNKWRNKYLEKNFTLKIIQKKISDFLK